MFLTFTGSIAKSVDLSEHLDVKNKFFRFGFGGKMSVENLKKVNLDVYKMNLDI